VRCSLGHLSSLLGVLFLKNQPYFVTINDSYFLEHSNLVEVLRKDSRLYLGVIIEVNNHQCFVPLRSEIKTAPKYRKAGYLLPSLARKNAGLDFRKLLLISNPTHITIQNEVKIPAIQKNKIYTDFDKISDRLNRYIKNYIKEVSRNRGDENYLYKFSTLKNYHEELGLKSTN